MRSNNEFLLSVYETARRHGLATHECVTLLRNGSIDWSSKEQVQAIGKEFKLGRLAGSLDLATRAEAALIAGLGNAKDGDESNKRRTHAEQKAHRAAISAWSHVAQLAGMPNSRNGAPRPPKARPRTSPVQQSEAQSRETDDTHAIPEATKAAGVAVFARRMADTIQAFKNQNAKVKFDDYRPLFDTFVDGVNALQLGKAE